MRKAYGDARGPYLPGMSILPRSARARFALVGLLLVAAGAGVAALLSPSYYHWVAVKEGVLYRSGQLEGDDLERAIREHGIRTVLNLRGIPERDRGEWYAAEAKATAASGARLVDVPIQPGEPPSPEQVATLLALFDDPAARPVLFHCEHGVTRSAAVEALWRREYLGETAEEALARTATFGRDLDEKYPKIAAFVREYRPRGPPAGAP
jgi:uncharacterized protein (TIGR01244 family)